MSIGRCPHPATEPDPTCDACSARATEARVLRWCWKRGSGHVMRALNDGTCAVLCVLESEPVPGGYEWERRSKRVATGATWAEVLAGLPELAGWAREG